MPIDRDESYSRLYWLKDLLGERGWRSSRQESVPMIVEVCVGMIRNHGGRKGSEGGQDPWMLKFGIFLLNS